MGPTYTLLGDNWAGIAVVIKGGKEMSHMRETQITDSLGDSREVVPLRYEITSYGADFLVDGLVRRLRSEDIITPSFQRAFVWTYAQASRFIESLLLGLPVPGVFLSKDFDTQKLVVIDGHQRLKTLRFFYDGIFADTGREFALRGVQREFDGLTYQALREEDRRRLDDSVLHATIVKQETPPEDDSSIYYIFERLNTTGTPLSPQELRHCIYHGKFNTLLKNLNANSAWRSVYGRLDKRMRDQELILRFLALYFTTTRYRKPMKEFLNQFMRSNLNLQSYSAEQITKVFSPTIETIDKALGRKAFRIARALNAAVYDSVMVAVARRLESGEISDLQQFRMKYEALIRDEHFEESSSRSTADELNVDRRIQMATEAFTEVE